MAGKRRGSKTASKQQGDSTYRFWLEDGGGCIKRNLGGLKELKEDPG